MLRKHPTAWRMIALALAWLLAGCSDFSNRRIGGVRDYDRLANEGGPPKAAPALSIASPPAAPKNPADDQIQKATFIPDRAPSGTPNPQMLQNPLRVLYQRAHEQQARLDGYIFRLRRRETVEGKRIPEELMRVQVRREPFSVHLKWLGPEGKGRETIYVKGKFNNEMQVLLAANDAFPFSPAGIRWSIAPDDARARARSRHPITSTGFASLIERFGVIVSAAEKADTSEGTAKYLGQVKRPEFDAPVEAVHQVLPPKSDPSLPRGGQRWWYFDATTALPVLLIAHDPDGEVEYYCHEHIQGPIRLDDDDFNPDRVWRKRDDSKK